MTEPTRLAGAPRSIAEIEFVAGTQPCELCGTWGVTTRIGHGGGVWRVRARCTRCGAERSYELPFERDLVDEEPPDLELGGPEPSQLLEPYALLREIDRLVPTIVAAPEELAEPAWSANEAAVERLRTALAELAKFLRGAQIPDDAHRTDAGRTDQRARPERYTRAWIDAERFRWDAFAERIAGDAPRILDADPILSRATPPRGRLDRDAVRAHLAWLARDQAGEGRLDVVTADARGIALPGADLRACRLEGVRLDGAQLELARLDRAELVEVQLTGARLEGASLVQAQLRACACERLVAPRAVFTSARVSGGSFGHADLERSLWRGARCEDARWAGASLRGADLRGAHFVGCSLRDAVLAGASIAEAVFDGCDLRGVDLASCDLSGTRFVGCTLGGAHGVPRATAGWEVTNVDLSEAGDGSDPADAAELLDELTAS